MTPYSAAAGGSRSSRASSRSAALRASSGQRRARSSRSRSSSTSACSGVALAELLLDRLQLLAQEVLALALLHLGLHLRLDLRAELEHLELAVEDRRDLAQPLLDVDRLEQLLPLLGLDRAQRRGDEVGERARVVDVRGGELELLGQVRRRAPMMRAKRPWTLRVSASTSGVSTSRVGQRLELADEVRVVVRRARRAGPAEALDEDPQRPVGHLDHLVDDRDRADLVDVVPAGRLDRRVPRRSRARAAGRRRRRRRSAAPSAPGRSRAASSTAGRRPSP